MSRVDEALRRVAEDRGEEYEQAEEPEPWTMRSYPTERVQAPPRIAPAVFGPEFQRGTEIESEPEAELESESEQRPDDLVTPAPRHAVQPTVNGRLVSGVGALPVHIEQHRRLAAVLHEAQAERQLKTLAVTSAAPREGKTLTAVNLALTLSKSFGRRVLLIDADLRRPSVHEVLGISGSEGLSDVLRAPRHALPLIDVSPRLSVLPAGGVDQNSLEALSSVAMRELLDECASRFDWVLIDTPPVGLLADAQIVARLAGAVLFVIAAGVTPFAAVERAIEDLGRESVIGTVLNRVDGDAIREAAYYANYDGEE